MSIPMSLATAQMIELAAKPAMAHRSISLRPQISESLAHIGDPAAFAKRYAPPIHVSPDADFNSEEMVGIAVAMMVWSKAAMNSDS